MLREQKYTAIVLKKQPFGEGDEIITFYSKENGKIRCLAKSIKKSLAKLQQKLQTLFLVEIIVSSNAKLPKIIRVETLKVYENLIQDLDSLKVAFFAMELMLKFTPDEQKNEKLFNVFLEFINLLDSKISIEQKNLHLAKFKLDILEGSGLAIDFYPELELSSEIYFSPIRGGFTEVNGPSSLLVDKRTFKLFLDVINSSKSTENLDKLPLLQNILSQFIEYQLERTLKAEKFINV